MNPEDIREFLAVCLMCGDGVPVKDNHANPDLVQQWVMAGDGRWSMVEHCHAEGLWSTKAVNASGVKVFYVTQKGKDLLL